MGGTAWVTLATNDSYALGALVVANSLKRVNTVHDLAILITPGVTLAMKNELLKVFNFVKEVDVFDSRDETNLRLLSRPDLGITFTKIHAWRLTQYSKCVFLDADVLIVQNCDELFDREELSAAPDAGWPDCFNSGVFVFKPSESTYNALVEFALVNGSFDGGDQGLLNLYFSDWATADSSKRLPFIYNMCSTSTYSYLPALKQFGSKVKIIHFIGSSKPWLQHFDSTTGAILSGDSHLTNFLQLWWDVFVVHVHPTLTTEMTVQRLSSLYNTSSVELLLEQYFPTPPPSFDQRPLPPILPPTNQPYTFIDPWENFVQTPVTSSHNPGNHNVNEYQEFQPNKHEGNSHQHHTSHQPQTATSSHSHTHHHAQNEHNDHTRHSFQNHSHQETHHNPSHHQEHHHNPFQNHQSHIHHSHNPGHSHHENNPSHSQPHTHHTFHSDNSNAQSFHESNPACSSSQELTINQDNEQLEEDVQQHEDCNENEAGLARALAQVPIGTPISAEQLAYEDHIHRQHWEEGHIDYLGKDSWDNIWKKISQTIEPSKPPAAEPSQTTSESTEKKESSPPTVPEVKPAASVEPVPVSPVPAPSTPPVATPTETTPAPVSTPTETAAASPVAAPVPSPTTPVESPAAPVDTPVTPVASAPPTPAETPGAPEPVPSPAAPAPVETPSVPAEPTPTASPVQATVPAESPVAAPSPPTPVESPATPVAPAPSPAVTPGVAPAVTPEVAPAPVPAAVPEAPLSPPAEAAPTPAAAEAAPTSAVSAAIASAVTISAAPAVSSASSETSASPGTPQVTPSTPIVTSPTPPQSPLSVVASKLEKLDIDPSVPETPPAGSEPPVPPKRKGSKDSHAGKSGKGKK